MIAPIAAAGLAALVPFAGIVLNPLTGVGTRVGCFDPLSLRATSSPVVIGEYHHAWTVSPDGSRVALGISAPGATARVGVRVVELGSWTAELDVETGIAAAGLAWLTDRRLVAGLLDREHRAPRPGHRGGGRSMVGGERRRRRHGPHPPRFLTLVTGRRVGRLSVVDAGGRLRRLSLRIPAAWPGRAPPAAGAGGPSAPRTCLRGDGRADGHRHRPSPDARSKAPRPAGAGTGRASGGDRVPAVAGDLARRRPAGPFGARPGVAPRWPCRDGSRRTEHDRHAERGGRQDRRRCQRGDPAPRRLLTYGLRGVRGYTLGGRRVFEVLRRNPVWNLDVAGRLAYAGTGTATYVIDTRSGRIRKRI